MNESVHLNILYFELAKYAFFIVFRNETLNVGRKPLRCDLTDITHIAFMFNGGQSPASILSPICTKHCTGHLHYKG